MIPKLVLILAAAFLSVLLPSAHAYMSQAQVKTAMKTLRNMCLPKTGVEKEALNKMVDEGEFDETNERLKCYLGCVLGMMQAIKDNKISLTMVKNQVSKMLAPEQGKRIVTAFESCQDTTGNDKCDLAFKFAKCVYETDKEAFIVP